MRRLLVVALAIGTWCAAVVWGQAANRACVNGKCYSCEGAISCTDQSCTCNGRPIAPEGGGDTAAPSAQYYYNDNGKQAGPFTRDEIKQKLLAGIITPDTLVWKWGAPSWVAAKEFPELGSGALVEEAGCKSPNILLSDDFSQTDPDQYRTFEGIKLKVKPGPHEMRWFTYNKPLSGDAEICVTIQLPHGVTDPTGTGAGVLFGGDDAGDFDFFFLWANGNASMLRYTKQSDKLDVPITPFKASGLNPSPGAKNRVRVRVQDGTATLFVNNQQFATYRGSLPSGAGKVGIIVQSESTRSDSWKFANFKATGLQ